MIFEWYSGSDPTKGAAKKVHELVYAESSGTAAEAIASELLALCEREQDPNMRARFLVEVAEVFGRDGQQDKLIEFSRMALAEFDLLAASFPLVLGSFVRACSHAASQVMEQEHVEALVRDAPTLMPILLAPLHVDPATREAAAALLANVFYELGQRHGEDTLFALAYVTALFCHHLEPDDPVHILTAYSAALHLRKNDEARILLSMLKEVDLTGDYLKRVGEAP